MAIKTRKQLADEIDELCDQAGCKDKIRQVHSKQHVDKHWNPHPPRAFLSWWNQDGPQLTKDATGRDWALIDAVRAFNCGAAREVFSRG